MSITVVLREAWRTTTAHAWRSIVGLTVMTAVLASGVAIEAEAVHRTMTTVEGEYTQGANVLIVSNQGGVLDGARCQALSHQDGVSAAGGATSTDVVRIGDPSVLSVRRVRATSGYFEILDLALPLMNGVVGAVGPGIAAELGVGQRSRLKLSDATSVTVARSSTESIAGERTRWLTVLAPTLPAVNECWVEVEPGALDAIQALVVATFGKADHLQVDSAHDRALLTATLGAWQQRWTRWAGFAAGAAATLFCGILLAPRRHEYALYKLLGMPRTSVWLICATEAALLTAAGALLSVGVVAGTLTDVSLPHVIEIARLAGAQLVFALCTVTVGVALVATALTSGSTAQVIRSRR
ncbi:hypothetical protein ACI3KX_09850 [Microbacterium sp. ZW CA_36]|uniref:hypothetical protein n=1 Tax=Microbacterium sp. ZW CA_36 TaxID=3378078 RepID=UPI003851E118